MSYIYKPGDQVRITMTATIEAVRDANDIEVTVNGRLMPLRLAVSQSQVKPFWMICLPGDLKPGMVIKHGEEEEWESRIEDIVQSTPGGLYFASLEGQERLEHFEPDHYVKVMMPR